MRVLMAWVLSMSVGSMSSVALASDQAFTGTFQGTGRACSGALHVRAKTIEWDSAYSVCKATHYEILEKKLDRERIVFFLEKRGNRCRYSVVEVEHTSGYSWNVTGYQSLEGFQKRDLPEWDNSPLPERQVLSCLMTKTD
ncbi:MULTISPECIES: hypothetical protein [unclassified Burkholderia]|uniref:hypothetical protein n=1 Tax=unclassified Burkholderia TaxID=2613784 RepID=UPI001E3095DA|nr:MULTISPECIES: hypothetical protein [unclassified Burkholderia]UEP28512.1 hypothetical protein LMA01_03550 [Burkholderia sp. B21-007]UEP41971.1 hypothetical protein LMA02_03105 [Burkholderia sp. B21-005]